MGLMRKTARLRKEYFFFLPNMITLFNLLTGFLSLVMASYGQFSTAAWLLVLSLVWDSLDGNIARMFNNPSELGRELDSLADVVSFVVAPVFLMSRFLLQRLSPWMLLFFFVYLAAGAYRLARFNVRPATKDHFEGLPTPASAMTLVMTVLACLKNDWTHLSLFGLLSTALIVLLSFLMVSRVYYPKLSALKFVQWRSLFYISMVLFVLMSFWFNVETAFASVFFLYVLIAPVYSLPASWMISNATKAK